MLSFPAFPRETTCTKSCGISNALDGAEDKAVWEEGAGADEADNKLENEFNTDSEQED